MTLHHGIMTEDNKADFADINITSTAFENIQRAVRVACAHTKKEDYEEKGDDTMATLYGNYLTDEERFAANERGRQEGQQRTFDIVPEILRLLRENVSVSEIANRFKVSTQDIEKLRIAL